MKVHHERYLRASLMITEQKKLEADAYVELACEERLSLRGAAEYDVSFGNDDRFPCWGMCQRSVRLNS
jgi:hypothetical protein